MPTVAEVGLVIHVLRVIQGLSQGELGRRAGVRNSSISNYERGKVVPKFESLQKLADGLGVPLSMLEETQSFIQRVRARTGHRDDPASGMSSPASGGGRSGEVEKVAADAGRVVSRLTRLLFESLGADEDGGDEEGGG